MKSRFLCSLLVLQLSKAEITDVELGTFSSDQSLVESPALVGNISSSLKPELNSSSNILNPELNLSTDILNPDFDSVSDILNLEPEHNSSPDTQNLNPDLNSNNIAPTLDHSRSDNLNPNPEQDSNPFTLYPDILNPNRDQTVENLTSNRTSIEIQSPEISESFDDSSDLFFSTISSSNEGLETERNYKEVENQTVSDSSESWSENQNSTLLPDFDDLNTTESLTDRTTVSEEELFTTPSFPRDTTSNRRTTTESWTLPPLIPVDPEDPAHSKNKRLTFILLGISGVLGVVLVLTLFYCIRMRQTRKSAGPGGKVEPAGKIVSLA